MIYFAENPGRDKGHRVEKLSFLPISMIGKYVCFRGDVGHDFRRGMAFRISHLTNYFCTNSSCKLHPLPKLKQSLRERYFSSAKESDNVTHPFCKFINKASPIKTHIKSDLDLGILQKSALREGDCLDDCFPQIRLIIDSAKSQNEGYHILGAFHVSLVASGEFRERSQEKNSNLSALMDFITG